MFGMVHFTQLQQVHQQGRGLPTGWHPGQESHGGTLHQRLLLNAFQYQPRSTPAALRLLNSAIRHMRTKPAHVLVEVQYNTGVWSVHAKRSLDSHNKAGRPYSVSMPPRPCPPHCLFSSGSVLVLLLPVSIQTQDIMYLHVRMCMMRRCSTALTQISRMALYGMTQSRATRGLQNRKRLVRVHLVHYVSFGEQGRPLAGILSTQSLPQSHFRMLHRRLVPCHLLQTFDYMYHTAQGQNPCAPTRC